MTTDPTPADQLRAVIDVLDDAESYLSALHDAVGRHDHIGADLTCGGCTLNARIGAALVVARRILGTTEQADTVTAPTVDWATVLKPTEREFLGYALDLAADRMASRDGFTDEDEAALDRLRRLAAEAQQPTPAVAGCEHVWTTALDGDDEPALTASGRTWTHCGICGQPATPAPAEETK